MPEVGAARWLGGEERNTAVVGGTVAAGQGQGGPEEARGGHAVACRSTGRAERDGEAWLPLT